MEWKDGKISKLVIKSKLGGNCRIRSFSGLKAEGNAKLEAANGENTNPFYQVPEIKKPLISAEAKLNILPARKSFTYDLDTNQGETYSLIGL